MTYDEAVRYLMALGSELAAPRQPAAPGAVKFGLRNIEMLAARLGAPHRKYPCVHVAGTNGKGSTAAMIESILRASGRTTGLYTSPHLEHINERIRISGAEIHDDAFAAAFSRLRATIEGMLASGELAAHPTFFECVTAMAFDAFSEICHPESAQADEGSAPGALPGGSTVSSPQSAPSGLPRLGMTGQKGSVDFAVFEVGMGGRLDSTNIVQPEVAVITQIDFDHENYLGHSIEAIAAEKAGIIKPGVNVVSAAERPEARAVIRRKCEEMNVPLTEIDAAYEWRLVGALLGAPHFAQPGAASSAPIAVHLSSREFPWQLDLTIPLLGRFQIRNAVAAVATARALAGRGFAVSDDAIARGIGSVEWPGRLERIQERPEVYLDGTHNPAGARELVAFWDEHLAGRRIHLVYGSVRDKAVDEVTGLLFPRAATVILTQPRQPRTISAATLADMTAHHATTVEVVADPADALERAIARAAPEDAVFATGSLYLVGDLRRWWKSRISKAPSTRTFT